MPTSVITAIQAQSLGLLKKFSAQMTDFRDRLTPALLDCPR